MIVNDVTIAIAEGRFPLILTERREHLEKLAELLKDKQDVKIYDYADSNVSVIEKMFHKRLKTYNMLGYSIHDEQQG